MSKKAKIILCAALVLLLALFCAARLVLIPEPVVGDKHIVFEVTGLEATAKNFDIYTNAETLGEALMQEKLIDAEEGPYGLWVTAIFGEKADDAKNQYWMFYKDGIELATGISDTYIADGEHYEARIVQY
ncbi:MAG: DUF4430 domain-containing protein [Oscillospiraceae bacterium]|nr:DUF4430 domain-containing protein [Oscillospiraceae bacterium]